MTQYFVAHAPAEQRELGHVNDEFRIGNFPRDPVKYAARHSHRRMFRAPLAITVDEIVAVFPFFDEFRDQLWGILAVNIDNDVSVALQIGETAQQRRLIAEIAAKKPDYVLILPWNIKTEICQQMDHIRSWGGKFLVAVPELNVF